MNKTLTIMPPETVEEAHTIIKAQLNQIKLLANENDFKAQQMASQREKMIEMERSIGIYKQQVNNLETKLRFYDQELKLKMNNLSDKNNKLMQQNSLLQKQNQVFDAQLKELQQHKMFAENEMNRFYVDSEQLKQKLQLAEDAFYREQERNRIKEDEIETLEDTVHQLTAENQDIKRMMDHMQRNSDDQMMLLNEKDEHIRRLSEFEHQYKDLRHRQDKDEYLLSNTSSREYEILKQRYDALVAEYQEMVLDNTNRTRKDPDSYFKAEIHQMKYLIEEKSREISKLNEFIQQLELKINESSISFETSLKKSISIIDGETTQLIDRSDNMAINLLNENIIRQNREFAKLNDKLRILNNDNRELRNHMSSLSEENINLKSLCDQKDRNFENLENKLRIAKEDHIKDLKFAADKYEEKLKESNSVGNKVEATLKEELKVSENLNIEYQNEVRRLTDKLAWVDEERLKALDFLQEQNNEISEFKERFFSLAEDASKQKAITRQYANVFAFAVKLIFSFLKRFEAIVRQKHLIYQYFYHYMSLKEKLVELNFFDVNPNHKRNNPIYRRFRRCGLAIIAANRMKKSYKLGRKTEDYDAKNALRHIPDGLKRILLNVFKDDGFEIKEEMLNQYENLLAREAFDEKNVLSNMIIIATKFNPSEYDPDKYYSELKKLERRQVEDLDKTFNIRSDFQMKFDNIDSKLRAAEDYIMSQEEKFKAELIENYDKIDALTNEKNALSLINEELESQCNICKKQVEDLINVIDKNSIYLTQSNKTNENLNERYQTLQDEILSIVKYRDFLEKEIEQKNLKIMELEARLIRGNQKENVPHSFGDTQEMSFSDKKPGLIYRSSSKKSANNGSFYY